MQPMSLLVSTSPCSHRIPVSNTTHATSRSLSCRARGPSRKTNEWDAKKRNTGTVPRACLSRKVLCVRLLFHARQRPTFLFFLFCRSKNAINTRLAEGKIYTANLGASRAPSHWLWPTMPTCRNHESSVQRFIHFSNLTHRNIESTSHNIRV